MNILILYYYNHEFPPRAAIRDHLYCFRNYSSANCYYLNIGILKLPGIIKNVKFDLIIFHTTLLSQRWGGSYRFNKVLTIIKSIKSISAIKLAFPQDEFIFCDDLCSFINDFNIDYVFTVTPRSELRKIYSNVDHNKVKFVEVLTGYLDDKTIKKVLKYEMTIKNRPIDIGYRAYKAPQWLGKHGFLKSQIADVFNEKAPEFGFITDISTNSKDTILGDNWYKFLLTCKYFIGVEGGSTVIDRNGSIRTTTEKFVKENPDADFNLVETNCFPGIDGFLKLTVISPRQLEACLTKTCQVLIEGNYNGILKPNLHYIELKKDFSNINEVLLKMGNESLRNNIIAAAYYDVVISDKYNYRSFVNCVFDKVLNDNSFKHNKYGQIIFYLFLIMDKLSWFVILIRVKVLALIDFIVKLLPPRMVITVYKFLTGKTPNI